jgi:hypothetical protein
MKGPRGKKGPQGSVPKVGGKALERLHQFERERDVELTDIAKPQPDRSGVQKEKTNARTQDDTRGTRKRRPPPS